MKEMIVTRSVIAGALLIYSFCANAALTVYTDEAAYLADLATLYTSLGEDFEEEAVWGGVRSSISVTNSAPSIISNGITWQSNYVDNEVTTASFTVKSGFWSFYSTPHGSFGRTDIDCNIPGNCGDGFIGSVSAPHKLYGIGGWVKTNSPPAKLGIYLDGVGIDLGDTCDPGGNNCVNNDELTTLYKFYGVIDTAGFTAFEFRELEGTALEQKYIFADTFTFAALDSDNDGVIDIADAFPFDPNESQDSDGDGVGDNSDNCTLAANPLQTDTNGDGYGNACDADLTDNGIVNTLDIIDFMNHLQAQDLESDFTENGIVNTLDIIVFINLFGQPPGPSGLVP